MVYINGEKYVLYKDENGNEYIKLPSSTNRYYKKDCYFKCGNYGFSKNNRNAYCEKCKKERGYNVLNYKNVLYICPKCGEEYFSNMGKSSSCPKCKTAIGEVIFLGNKIPVFFDKIKNLKYISVYNDKMLFYETKCYFCGRDTFKDPKSKYGFCDECILEHEGEFEKPKYLTKCFKCNKEIFVVNPKSIKKCKNCKNKSDSVLELEKLNSDKILYYNNSSGCYFGQPIPKRNEKLKFYGIKRCVHCNREFFAYSPNANSCQNCYPIIKCLQCGNWALKSINFWKKFKNKGCFCSRKCQIEYFHDKNIINKVPKLPKSYKNRSINIKEFNFNLSLIDINSINISDFDKKTIIWIKCLKDKVLDVMLTKNIIKEYRRIKNNLDNPKNTAYKNMSKYKEDIKFFICITDIDWDVGVVAEEIIAHHFEAKYWNAAPNQNNIILPYKERGAKKITLSKLQELFSK